LKEARNGALNRNNDYNPIKSKPDVIKFKLGEIDLQALKEQNSKNIKNDMKNDMKNDLKNDMKNEFKHI
jgi:hypothetical protein